jgi:hypothetical protein
MSKLSNYEPGNWKAICDVCGFQFMGTELVLGTAPGQQGLRVCRKDLDLRNMQDFIRQVPEKIVPPWVRPDSDVSATVQWVNNSLWGIPWTNNLTVTIEWVY